MRKMLLHLIFWIVFFLMWNRLVNFYISNNLNRVYFSVLDVSLIVSAFYIIYLYVMPDYLRRKRIGRLIGLSILLTILLAGIHSWIMGVFLHHGLMPINFHFSWDYTDMQYNRFFIALIGVLGGCFVKLAIDRLEVGRKMEIMEKEKSKAELTYLKAQINPHFLFNSLNSLYAQLELNPEGARGTLVSIADLLRYQLYECNTDFILVEKELNYLNNYFNLQKIRNDNCTAIFDIEGDPDKLMIAPLLLIPFVENAFKYVSDYDNQENYIKARIDIVNSELNFYCINTFDAASSRQRGNMNKGIGLINVKKRLELIYSNHFSLKEEDNNGSYQVALTLNLK
jgi:two-component system, LytTR family, sensor kinase